MFLLEGSDTKGQLAAFEFTVPVAARVPVLHSHKDFDETLYGIEGVMTFTVNGASSGIGPGQALLVPRGAVHGLTNLGNTNAKCLAVVTPGVLGPDHFRKIAAIVNAGGPPNVDALRAVMLKHGLVPAMPRP